MKKNLKINKLYKLVVSLILFLILFYSIIDIAKYLNISEKYEKTTLKEKETKYLSENIVSNDMCIYLSDIDYIKEQSSAGWGSITLDSNLETKYNHGLITLLIDDVKTYFLKGISAHATSTLVYDIIIQHIFCK